MLYYCEFTWFPGTTAEDVKKRIVQQDAAGKTEQASLPMVNTASWTKGSSAP